MVNREEQYGGSGPSEDGLINPIHFICRAEDLDGDALERAAETLRTMGVTVASEVGTVSYSWSHLPTHYQAPEQELVYDLMSPAVDSAARIDNAFWHAAYYLSTFEASVMNVKPKLVDLTQRATDFHLRVVNGVLVDKSEAKHASVGDHLKGAFDWVPHVDEGKVMVPWNQDSKTVEENQRLLEEYSEILGQVSTAATDCANAIAGLMTHSTLETFEAIPPEAFLSLEEPMPWGAPVIEDRNWAESAKKGAENFGTGMVDGAGMLIGRDPETGAWSWGTAFDTYKGLANLGVSLNPLLQPYIIARYFGVPMLGPIDGWLEDRQDVAATFYGSFIGFDYAEAKKGGDGWHAWKEDGIAALTETVLNIGTMFIPGAGQAGTGVRVGSRAARALRALGTVTDVVIPGSAQLLERSARMLSGIRGAAHDVSIHPTGLADDALRALPHHGDGARGLAGHPSVHGPDVRPHDGHGGNGHDGNRHGGDGHGGNGHEGNRHGGDGHGGNVHDGNRHGGDGHGGNGHDGNRHGGDGHGGNGHDGNRHGGDGHGGNGHDGNSHDGNGHGRDERGGNGHRDDGAQFPRTGTARTPDAPIHTYDPDASVALTVRAGDAPRSYTPTDVQQALDNAPVDRHGNPVDPRTGQPLRLTDRSGRRGWVMRWDPESQDWVAQNRGAGYPRSMPLTGTPNTYGYDANGNLMQYFDDRPNYGPGQVETVFINTREAQIEAAENGWLLDEHGNELAPPGANQVWVQHTDDSWHLITWEPGQPRRNLWDMGHMPGSQYRDLRDRYLNHEISLKTFLEEYQDADNYLVEDPSRNRSHVDE